MDLNLEFDRVYNEDQTALLRHSETTTNQHNIKLEFLNVDPLPFVVQLMEDPANP